LPEVLLLKFASKISQSSAIYRHTGAFAHSARKILSVERRAFLFEVACDYGMLVQGITGREGRDERD